VALLQHDFAYWFDNHLSLIWRLGRFAFARLRSALRIRETSVVGHCGALVGNAAMGVFGLFDILLRVRAFREYYSNSR